MNQSIATDWLLEKPEDIVVLSDGSIVVLNKRQFKNGSFFKYIFIFVKLLLSFLRCSGIFNMLPLIQKLIPLDFFLINGLPSQDIALPILNKENIFEKIYLNGPPRFKSI